MKTCEEGWRKVPEFRNCRLKMGSCSEDSPPPPQQCAESTNPKVFVQEHSQESVQKLLLYVIIT